PWEVSASTPADFDAAVKDTTAKLPADLLEGGSSGEVDDEGKPIPKPTLAKGPVPGIVVSTEPAELVIFDGAAKWQAIPGTGLEFVENTTGNVFRQGGTFYVLTSG